MDGELRRAAHKLVFFAQDVSDTSTVKRAEAFVAEGFELVLFSFLRGRYHRDFAPPWPVVPLGRTTDGRYLRRALALFRGAITVVRNRNHLSGAEAFYARNIDQLLLALFARALFRRGAPVVYEVLDIQPAFVRRGIPYALLRAVERFSLRLIALLVVSSPAFVEHYFRARQGYMGLWRLLENKLPPSALSLPRCSPADPRKEGYVWTVGYFGLIRGDATFAMMERVAARVRDRVQFQIRGVFTTVDREGFDALLSRNSNMAYLGEYVSPRDLPALYGAVDFAWAIDLENQAHNSRWLLPCRFYEAGFFGVPCLGVRGYESGNYIERLKAGWTFAEPLEESLVRFFQTLTPEEYLDKRARLTALPARHFVGGADDLPLDSLLGRVPP
ncbi:MAG: glycosyltransferase family protein [Alphaproteobacteria bacterium]